MITKMKRQELDLQYCTYALIKQLTNKLIKWSKPQTKYIKQGTPTLPVKAGDVTGRIRNS